MPKLLNCLHLLRNGFKCLSYPYSNPRLHLHSYKNTQLSDSIGLILNEVEQIQALKPRGEPLNQELEEPKLPNASSPPPFDPKVEISHKWPEWLELMECVLKKGYFMGVSPFASNEVGRSQNLAKDSNRIRTACLNFGRDRFDLIRYFSRKDIQVIVGSGCPNLDRKVVNSGKRLRAHVGIDEGDVCCSCNLRGSCERAYVKARQDEGGRTVDVMRILLTFALDPVVGSVENKLCLSNTIKESVRSLIKEMVKFSAKELAADFPKANSDRVHSRSEYSTQQQITKPLIEVPMKQGDWICPKCKFVNFAKNFKCLRCDGIFQERLKRMGADHDNLPLKKGDWLCGVCNFLNFARNTKCLQCNEKPPKRRLGPGEWECISCNYINFRRNMVCLKCDWRRPKAANSTDNPAQSQNEDRGSCQDNRKMLRSYIGLNNHSFVKTEREYRNDNSDFWDSDENQNDKGSKFLEFEDFPILGGKSSLSQDPQEWEKKKSELSKKGKNGSKLRGRVAETYAEEWRNGSDNGLDAALSVRRIKFGEHSDDDGDDEMAEWFGSGRKK